MTTDAAPLSPTHDPPTHHAPTLSRTVATQRFGRARKRNPRRLALIAVVLLLVLAVLLYDRMFIVIRAGEAGVQWDRFVGTEIERVYGEGLNIISPLNRMYIYEVRKQIVVKPFSVLSAEGLRLDLDIAIRFRPVYRYLGLLHERIGPEYVTRVVAPQTESVLRRQLGSATAEAIYTNKDDIVTKAVLLAMDEVGRNFVDIEDIIIRSIKLPEVVRRAINDKIRQEQLLKSYEFREAVATNEAERKRIEAAGRRDYQALVNESLSDRLITNRGIELIKRNAETATPKTLVLGGQDAAVSLFVSPDQTAETTTAPEAGDLEAVLPRAPNP
ncbi:MAG: prohibitin family protein [Pseudomonadota bacterium]